MITTDELVKLTGVQDQQSVFKLGIVIDLFETGTARVQFDGEESPSQKEYTYLASYTPRLNDRVLLASVGGTYIILDAIYYKQIPNISLGDLKDNISTINDELEYKVESNMSGDTDGDMNVDYVYIDPSNNRLVARRKNGTFTNYYDKTYLDQQLSNRITSNMTDDVGGNLNIDYMYVNPTTGRLSVRRKNGAWTYYAAI